MNYRSSRTMSSAMITMLVAVSFFPTPSAQSDTATLPGACSKPLLLEKNEGERRIWREPPPGDFVLKVSPKNNSSQHLVMLTEEMNPGDEIPAHKHLGQDEILYIAHGTVHVHLADQERDLHAGGTVFIPANTWISVKPLGTEAVSLVAVCSEPGFEDYMRLRFCAANRKSGTYLNRTTASMQPQGPRGL